MDEKDRTTFFDRTDDFEIVIANELSHQILENKYLNRLKSIRFLGIYDYIENNKERKLYSRYQHVISVAYLTFLYCKNLGIKPTEMKVALLAALFHDIGLGPLSHSTEKYQFRKSGFNQNYHSTMKLSKFRAVVNEISDYLPIEIKTAYSDLNNLALDIAYLIFGKSMNFSAEVNLMFYNPFCPDTFDGIGRAIESLKMDNSSQPIDPVKLVNLISTNGNSLIINSKSTENPIKEIKRFHKQMKSLYYDKFYNINSMATEAMIIKAMECAFQKNENIRYSKITDECFLKRISNSDSYSALIFSLIRSEELFKPLSITDSEIFRWAKEQYNRIRLEPRNIYLRKFSEIESTVAEKYHLKREFVIAYTVSRLIWKEENVEFSPYFEENSETDLRKICWTSEEGTPEKEENFEVYIPSKNTAIKHGLFDND